MSKTRTRANGDADVYPRKNKDGKVVGYRGSFWVETPQSRKRRYVSGKTKAETRTALSQAKADSKGGFLSRVRTLHSPSIYPVGFRAR